MILLIDNYDSFTYNIYQTISELDDVLIYKNDKVSINKIESMNPSHIIISPGSGLPSDAGILVEVVKHFADKTPILGIGLGHQCIAKTFGGKLIKTNEIHHGRVSKIFVACSDELFDGITNPFNATRYDSLVVSQDSFPNELKILALTEENEIMAIRHRFYWLYGVQFHPESILTSIGFQLLENFMKIGRSVNYV
ncbi:MAG TPA: aminodeoxychorismate/anthranilate synthase component II [Defluviitoga sp.]|nr:aminodeoxychorismate/anthranilate synthase component II [Defluviitoga sp.]HPZ29782.1 aminodeoxychorismate/anthranilate synthase component II [Defluviitoga sp.]HQD63468.1 aminodeoxychorismate/anthranilate synthase component II [Defluviitoga sp.]